MPDVLVRDVSKKTVEALKRRAKRQNRSLQQEVKTILERTAEGDLAERLAPHSIRG
jgi:plasmid stability protein